MPGKNRAGYGGTSANVPGANAQPAAGKKAAKKAVPPFVKKKPKKSM